MQDGARRSLFSAVLNMKPLRLLKLILLSSVGGEQFKITQLISRPSLNYTEVLSLKNRMKMGHQEYILKSRQRFLVGYASENRTIFHVSHSTFCIHCWNLQHSCYTLWDARKWILAKSH